MYRKVNHCKNGGHGFKMLSYKWQHYLLKRYKKFQFKAHLTGNQHILWNIYNIPS